MSPRLTEAKSWKVIQEGLEWEQPVPGSTEPSVSVLSVEQGDPVRTGPQHRHGCWWLLWPLQTPLPRTALLNEAYTVESLDSNNLSSIFKITPFILKNGNFLITLLPISCM